MELERTKDCCFRTKQAMHAAGVLKEYPELFTHVLGLEVPDGICPEDMGLYVLCCMQTIRYGGPPVLNSVSETADLVQHMDELGTPIPIYEQDVRAELAMLLHKIWRGEKYQTRWTLIDGMICDLKPAELEDAAMLVDLLDALPEIRNEAEEAHAAEILTAKAGLDGIEAEISNARAEGQPVAAETMNAHQKAQEQMSKAWAAVDTDTERRVNEFREEFRKKRAMDAQARRMLYH